MADDNTITVKGKSYDINKDFTWGELMLVEDLVDRPLNSEGTLDSIAAAAAFIYVVEKRGNEALTWEKFCATPLADYEEPAAQNGNGAVPEKAASKPRPTRAKSS